MTVLCNVKANVLPLFDKTESTAKSTPEANVEIIIVGLILGRIIRRRMSIASIAETYNRIDRFEPNRDSNSAL